MAMVQVEFAKLVKVHAEVLFIHPIHNVVLLKVDKKRLGDFAVHLKSPPKFSRKNFGPGDNLYFVGLTAAGSLVQQDVAIMGRIDVYWCCRLL